MRKKLPISMGILTLFLLGLFSLNHNNNIDNLKKRQAYFLKNSPINKNLSLTKRERLSKGLPPNKYFEREYLLEMNPALGRPTPEKLYDLQKQLNSNKNTAQRVPGDNVSNLWEERGPNNVGGRTRAILFDPNDVTHKRVFAGGVSGGLWVNSDITNANSAWTRVSGISENISVTAFTVDPNNSNNIFIATGETYTSGDVTGNGIWGSTDGGNTWSHVFGGKSGPTTSYSGPFLVPGEFNVNDIKAWNNGGSTVIFAAVGSNSFHFSGVNPTFIGSSKYGLYKSSDNGANWLKVSLLIPPALSHPYEINDIEIAADNSIWVSTRNTVYLDGGGKILHSIDGASFTAIDSISNGKRTQIAVSSTNAGTIYVLAEVKTVDSTGTIAPYLKILKTTDGFATAPTTLALPNDADTGIPANDFTRGQAFYDLMLEVDPNNDAIVYVGGIDSFRSDDSGANWTQMTRWVDFGGLTIPIVHSDFHALVFNPANSDIAILGNDGGVYYASSLVGALSSTTAISSRNKNYNVTQFYKGAIGQSTSSDMFLGGLQDNGSQFISGASAGINSFTAIRGGDGAYEFIDKDGAYLITSYVYNTYDLYPLPYTGTGKITIQYDQGTGAFINPADLDDTLNILYAEGYKAATDTTPEIRQIARYTGLTTTPLRTNLTNTLLTGRPTAFKVSPPYFIGSTTLYVGTDDGKLLKITQANTTPIWTDITGGSFVGSVSAIGFGANTNQNEIIVTFHNYGVTSIWFTVDGGTTWEDKEGDLPDLPVKAVMMNPLNNDEVIVGTDLGVWRTENFKTLSPNWIQSQNGMQNSKVTSFDLRTADNTVLASTYGRGLFTGKFTSYTTDEFVTTWQTTSDGESITIPTTGSGYNYKVDWDIYNSSVAQTGDATHIYATAGIHTIKITGTFPRIYFSNSYDKNKILTIEQWGTNAWTSMNYAFDGCTNLTDNTNDSPNLSNVTDMSFMFYNASSFNGNLNNWDVSNVINMNHLFYKATTFNGAINNWNVSNVTNMNGMFLEAKAFNQDLISWDVSSVMDMSSMFKIAWAFNGNINNWDVSSVTNMSSMFAYAKAFNQDINSWNVSNVTDMNNMFNGATVFNGNISSWNVGIVTNMSRMFQFTSAFNQNLNNWDVSSVTDMNYMFGSANAFNQDLTNWNVSGVTNMSYMFNDSQSFNGNINTWNVSGVTNMKFMFNDAPNFNQDLNNWDVSNVTDMSSMFSAVFKGPPTFNGNISTWNVSNVINMRDMFRGASAFNRNISSWDVSSASNMNKMFYKASSFNQGISSWNVSKVWDMNSMFFNAFAFDQDLGNWDISSVTNMNSIFSGVKLSTPNYDNTLIGWSTLSTGETKIPTGISFNGGNSFYCAGETARNSLTGSSYNWSIFDGGKNCSGISLWTGAINTSWNNASNWDNGIPSLSIFAAIPNVTNKPVINTTGVVCNSLTIFSGSSFTITSGGNLTVNGNLTNNGTFTINSDASSSGSLIVNGTSTGNVTYNRHMTGGSDNSIDWHLIVAPVGNQSISSFVNNSANKITKSGAFYSLTPYDNTVAAGSGNWTHWTTDGSGLGNVSGAGNFIAGKGYEVHTNASGPVAITGAVATSQVSIPITKPASNNAWNLIGNPFPSSITTADFINGNIAAMDASFVAIYLWNPATSVYDLTNSTTGATYIAPGQAFFVKSKAGGATINFTTAMRTNQPTVAFQKSATPATPTITLKADNGSTIKTTDIKYIAGATLGLDPGYDAGLIDATSSNFKLYTHLVQQDNGVDFMLQVLPDNVYDTAVIPVGLDAVLGTQITFKADITNLPLGKKVYLEDRLLGVYNELNNTDKSYTLTFGTDINGIGRFYLHTLDNLTTLGVNDFTKLNFSVIAEPNNNNIRVIGNIEDPGKLDIYDTLGKLIKSLKLKTANDQIINVPNMAAGIYMVKISSKNSQFSTKIAWY